MMMGTTSVPELAAVLAAIEALAALDPVRLADGDAVVALASGLARMEAVACQQAEAFAVHGDWRPTGARHSAMWVMTECRQRKTVAFRRARLGHWLPRVAHVRAAFLAGEINEDHVHALWVEANRNADTFTAFERDEADLVGWARTLRFDDFRHVLGHWRLHADPIGSERDAESKRSQRRLHLSKSIEDLWLLDGVFDPIGGEIVDSALKAIGDELFDADWALAKERLGRTPSLDELAKLTRTPAQRRADALVEMAKRSQAVPAGARMPSPLFTVLIGEDTFRQACAMASGSVVTPGSLVPWMDDMVFERVVFDGPDRVLSVSYQRAFTGAVRRAIQLRDRRCTHRYCDQPAGVCELDHDQPYAQGGQTSQTNGRLLCAFHHRQRTQRQTGKRTRTGRATSGSGDDEGGNPGGENDDSR